MYYYDEADNNVDLHEELNKARKGKTFREIARATGLTPQTVESFLCGYGRHPRFDTFLLIANSLQKRVILVDCDEEEARRIYEEQRGINRG